MRWKYMVVSEIRNVVVSILLALLTITQAGCETTAKPEANDNIIYKLPAKTTATIVRLLAGNTPTYVFFNYQSQNIVLLTFSFEKLSEINPEHLALLRAGNRLLKINEKTYPILFDYDILFYPQKSYLDGGGMFNSMDIYVNARGEFLKSTNWTLDKTRKNKY